MYCSDCAPEWTTTAVTTLPEQWLNVYAVEVEGDPCRLPYVTEPCPAMLLQESSENGKRVGQPISSSTGPCARFTIK